MKVGDLLAGVCRHAGGLCLFDGPDRSPSTGLREYATGLAGIAEEVFAYGGRAPATATRAVMALPDGDVDAHLAKGAWVAVLPGVVAWQDLPVRFEDNSGAIVPRPAPRSWTLTPHDGPGEPCLACGGRQWAIGVASNDSWGAGARGDAPLEPTPHTVCSTCGWWTSTGWSYGPCLDGSGAHAGEVEHEAEIEAFLAAERDSDRAMLATLSFQPVGVVDHVAVLVAYGGHSGRPPEQITLSCRGNPAGPIEVDTRIDDFPQSLGAAAGEALALALTNRPALEPPGSVQALDTRRFETGRAAAAAPTGSIELRVDGGLVTFTTRVAAGWTAVAADLPDGRRVILTGADREWARVALESHPDAAQTVLPWSAAS